MNDVPGCQTVERTGSDSIILIEGYASIFGVTDRSGDIVRPGAFARSLRRAPVAMFVQHRHGPTVGRWTRLVEDGRGLFVRGLVETDAARNLILKRGFDGLSIGFRPRVWRQTGAMGRTLADVDLIEISLVNDPMLTQARFVVI
ncbi:MAG: HK97 family phage prohead protease [Henriciella sp.]